MAFAAARVSKARGVGVGERIRERQMVCIVVKDDRSGQTAGEERTAAAEGDSGGAGRASWGRAGGDSGRMDRVGEGAARGSGV